MRTRHGWTRMDALALAAVLFLFAGMAMTARARNEQAGNRMKTTNNLKILGLGFHNYENAMGAFPSNGGSKGEAELTNINYGWHHPDIAGSGTWATQIAPYIEQHVFYTNNAAKAKSIEEFPDYPAESWKVEIKFFLCAERARKGVKTSKEKGCFPGPVTDFAINLFLGSPPNGYSDSGFANGELKDGCNGDWANGTGAKIINISDGLSNTIMIGEKALPPALAKKNINYDFTETISYTNAPIPKAAEQETVKDGDEGILSPGNWGFKDKNKLLTSTGTARGHAVVKDPPKENAKEHPKDGSVPWLYQDSELAGDPLPPYHLAWGGPFSQGVLFTACDGSVHLIKYNQKGSVNLARLLYPADGNVAAFD